MAEGLMIQEALSKKSWKDFFTATSAASLALGPIATSAGGVIAALEVGLSTALSVTNFGITVSDSVYTQYREETELGYALGASAVIGTARYNTAVANDSSWWKLATAVLSVGFKAGKLGLKLNKFAKAPPVASQLRGVAKLKEISGKYGKALLSKTEGKLRSAIPKWALSNTDWRDVMAAIHRGRGLEIAIGRDAMEPDELLALEFVDDMAQLAQQQPLPEWASTLDVTTIQLLDDLVYRDDINRLGEADAATVAGYVRQPDGLRVLHRPQTSIGDLKQTVDALNNTPGAHDSRFMQQAAEPDYWKPERKLNEQGYYFERQDRNGELLLDVYEGIQKTHRGLRMKRSKVPDISFSSGKHMVLIEGMRSSNATAELPHADRHVIDTRLDYHNQREGVPIELFAELRTYASLGFEHADPGLGGVVLKNVQAARLVAEMHWLRHQYPEWEVDDLFEYTTTWEKLSAVARQLGFELGAVQLRHAAETVDPWEPTWTLRAPLQHVTVRTTFAQRLDEEDWDKSREKFLELYNLAGNEPRRKDSAVPFGYDIHVQYVPLGTR